MLRIKLRSAQFRSRGNLTSDLGLDGFRIFSEPIKVEINSQGERQVLQILRAGSDLGTLSTDSLAVVRRQRPGLRSYSISKFGPIYHCRLSSVKISTPRVHGVA